jgi:hypothetical protein
MAPQIPILLAMAAAIVAMLAVPASVGGVDKTLE